VTDPTSPGVPPGPRRRARDRVAAPQGSRPARAGRSA